MPLRWAWCFCAQEGTKGDLGASIIGWTIDHENYVAIPLMSDGRQGPALELRGFFEQFSIEAR
jgi:hypothetical protein